MEWQTKDLSNPNNKITHSIKASMLSKLILHDQMTGQYVPEVHPHLTQHFTSKITLQLTSKQIFEFLLKSCTPPIKNLLLVAEPTQQSQEFRNALNNANIGVTKTREIIEDYFVIFLFY